MGTKNSYLRIFVIILLSSVMFNGCKDTPYTPTLWEYPELTESLETQNFIFHYSEGDQVDSIRQEAFHEWAVNLLGILPPKKIDFYKYIDRAHMVIITGKETNGWANPANFAIHTIWSWDNHECVHCYTSLIGRPSDFFNEGIAVGMSTNPYNGDLQAKWWSESVHYWAKRYKDEGTLLSLEEILETNNFRSYDSEITYPESGSFVSYLIVRNGIDTLKGLFRQGNRMDLLDTIKQTFQNTYGFSIELAEQEWLIFLDSY